MSKEAPNANGKARGARCNRDGLRRSVWARPSGRMAGSLSGHPAVAAGDLHRLIFSVERLPVILGHHIVGADAVVVKFVIFLEKPRGSGTFCVRSAIFSRDDRNEVIVAGA
jgi:hypothetical protein